MALPASSAAGASSPPPDIMNDPEFETNKDSDRSPGEGDTCRICRSEGSASEPLFYPCKCSGSIKFVHQDCLMEWLSHSNKKHCELCKTPFRFTKLYDSHMPQALPLSIFLKRACVHTFFYILTWARAIAVGLVWLVTLPWCIRWAWRGLFWVLDAGWARDVWLAKMVNLSLQRSQTNGTVEMNSFSFQPVTVSLSRLIVGALFNPWKPISQHASYSHPNSTRQGAIVPPYSTLLSDVKAVNTLTSSDKTNKFIVDVLEGQIITCVVVVAFILVFLIREWVVQQQPIINAAAAQIQEAAMQLDAAEQAVQQLQDLEDDEQARGRFREARDRLEEHLLGEDTDSGSDNSEESPHFNGWAAIETLMFNTAAPLELEDEHSNLYQQAVDESKKELFEQLELARESGVATPDIAQNLHTILGNLDPPERDLWSHILTNDVLMNDPPGPEEVTDPFRPASATPSTVSDSNATTTPEDDETAAQSGLRRPAMPPRDTSSHAQGVLRSIEEGGSADQPAQVDAESTTSGGSWESVANLGASPFAETRASSHTQADAVEVRPHSASHQSTDGSSSGRSQSNWSENSVQDDPTSAGSSSSSENTATDTPPAEASDGETRDSIGSEPQIHEMVNAFPAADQDESLHGVAQETQPADDPSPGLGQQEPQKAFIRRLFDWFWADIVPDGENDPLPGTDDEAVIGEEDDDDPFVHIHGGQVEQPVIQLEIGQDPEVLRAAAEAGLDADAIEDAEDLEGVLELIGMQGPIVGLLQTAMFCGVLITTTLWLAVGIPYLFGKLALICLGDPLVFAVMAPLRLVSLAADAVVDSTIYVCGAATYLIARTVSYSLLFLLGPILQTNMSSYPEVWAKRAHSAANAAAARLSGSFSGEGPFETGFLMVSISARQSLLSLKSEISQVFGFIAWSVSEVSYHVHNSTLQEVFRQLVDFSQKELRAAGSCYSWAREAIQDSVADAMKNGSFTFTIRRENPPLDPNLAYWTATDRCLAILAGYILLAMLGTMYLLRKEPIFGSPNIQKIEKSFTDILKQAGGVFKVILIISIEMLVFPLYCGMLLDCALLPLFENTTVASRLAFASQSPWLFAFLHWFIGTCYMFHFALFVSMCRRVMRNGVLYFIRDPDDPTFHPVRDVLERSVTTQLRKIAFSALVYGGLVIVCLGGVVWSTDSLFTGIFPIRWARPESVLEFPIDFLLYNLLAPVVAKFLFPSRGMEEVFGQWLKLCARRLRLSHFLFDQRRKVEEGHRIDGSWFSNLRSGQDEDTDTDTDAEDFVKDGRYVRAPGSDQVRIPKGDHVFLEVTEDDQRIDGRQENDTGIHGRQNRNFTMVYVPPRFRLRIAAFIACLWVFAAATGLGITVLPMVCGRKILGLALPQRVLINDLYAFTVGLITMGSTVFVAVKGRSGLYQVRDRASKQSLLSLGAGIKTQGGRFMRSLYVYGFAIIVVPTLFALVLQLYFVLPLHTYLGSAAIRSGAVDTMNETATAPSVNGSHPTLPSKPEANNLSPFVASHTIHILQDWTLGFLYGRVVLRLLVWSRNSRAAAALRMITRDGITNPNVRLATRAFVVPTLILFAVVLFCPPLLASMLDVMVLSASVSSVVRTKVYRYSYPICASQALALWCVWELAKATQRWRGRIKDEVYLIGERLHNFGERRPPEGSKSVARARRQS